MKKRAVLQLVASIGCAAIANAVLGDPPLWRWLVGFTAIVIAGDLWHAGVTALDAVDPHAADSGTPSTRVSSSSALVRKRPE